MRSGDTTPEAAAIQLDIIRRKTGAERVELALEMSRMVRELQLAGLRNRFPDLSERDLLRRLVLELYSIELPRDLP